MRQGGQGVAPAPRVTGTQGVGKGCLGTHAPGLLCDNRRLGRPLEHKRQIPPWVQRGEDRRCTTLEYQPKR